jgi:hypothetical protein
MKKLRERSPLGMFDDMKCLQDSYDPDFKSLNGGGFKTPVR